MSGEESAGGNDAEDVEHGRADYGPYAEVRLGDKCADHVGEEFRRARALKKKKPRESRFCADTSCRQEAETLKSQTKKLVKMSY